VILKSIENFSLSFQSSDTLVKGKIESDFLNADFYSAGSLEDLKRAFSEGGFQMTALLDSAAGKRIPYFSVLPETSLSVDRPGVHRADCWSATLFSAIISGNTY